MSQEKYIVVRKLFSEINGFGKVSIFSKFVEIIRAMFTFKLSLVQAFEKTTGAKILIVVVKKISVGMSAKAVYTILFEFRIIKLIKIQLIKHLDYANLFIAKWFILIRKDVVYATVCFNFTKLLDAIIKITLVLKDANLHWSHLVFAKYTKYENLGHTSLGSDKSRLTTIYVKCLAPIARPVAFGGVLWIKSPLLVANKLKLGLVNIESSFTSFAEQISKLAKRLELLIGDIVIKKGSIEATGGKAAAVLSPFASPKVVKLENMLKDLSVLVLNLSAYFNNLVLASEFGYLGSDVAVIMNVGLTKHVCKISEIAGRLLFIKLLFKNKLSISILELYTGAALTVYLFQASNINSLIVKAVDKSFFVILSENFNKDSLHR
ncbi:hypothetical protein G9A89_019042 [Geosiphon pyriformis]|nr:hypothetical protein G9A89_019042 [Geosiphon pyriformis]